MVTSVEDLVARASADAGLTGLFDRGDWYLVGSRAHGFQDELSDWDTVLLTAHDPTPEEHAMVGRARLDAVFGVDRPPAPAWSELDGFVGWRRCAGVEISVFGPAGRAHREGPIWAYELSAAVPLRVATGVGEPYRAAVATSFEAGRVGRRDEEYLLFRMARNEAAATLARTDTVARAVTTGVCVRHACRFWLLAAGSSYPADKWLPAALGYAQDLLALTRAVTDAATRPEDRYAALSALWRLVDARAVEVGVDDDLLAGSPFVG